MTLIRSHPHERSERRGRLPGLAAKCRSGGGAGGSTRDDHRRVIDPRTGKPADGQGRTDIVRGKRRATAPAPETAFEIEAACDHLQPPIFVWEPNDLVVFGSVDDACRHVEKYDFDIVSGYDATGRKFRSRLDTSQWSRSD